LPRDRCHFARNDIDLERAAPADSTLFLFHRHGVVTRRQRNAKSTLIISREGRDDALLVFHGESNLCQWTRIGNAFSAGARMDRGNGNHAFDSRARFGLCLPQREASRHHEKDQRDWDSASLHSHINLTTSNRVKSSASQGNRVFSATDGGDSVTSLSVSSVQSVVSCLR
jgi:hypothetical protein